MTKTKKKKKQKRIYTSSREDRIDAALTNLKHSDLQRECVKRGMLFEQVIAAGHHKLVSWFYEHFENSLDETKVTEYDVRLEDELKKRGYKKDDVMLSPALRLGYVKGMDKIDKPVDIKPSTSNSVPKNPKKPKAEIDEQSGVRKGTKKHMTYDLTRQGITIDDIGLQVKKAFPDAELKSIRIWYKRCLKEMEEKK